MTIRLAEKKDIKSIVELGKKDMIGFSFNEDDFASYIQETNSHLVLVAEEKTILGFISIRFSVDEGEIDAIVVTSSRQHKGIGSQLLTSAIESLVQKNIIHLLLEVRRNNMFAFRFYKKHGFTTTNIRQNYYGAGEDAFCMKKEIIKQEREKVRRKNEIILAVESSCDESALAIIKNGKEIIANTVNTQIAEHQKYGGVYPELASRLHLQNMPKLLNYLLSLKDFDFTTITHVAFTQGPGLPGALQIGSVVAKTIASYLDVPLIGVNHLAGHIYAGELVKPYLYPALALVASGGNSEIVLLKESMSFKIIGQTLDDAIGEALDKVARLLGLPYPGGKAIDDLVNGKEYPLLNLPKVNVDGYNFSYSGIKSHIARLVEKEKEKGELSEKFILSVAYSVQKIFVDQMLDKLFLAAKDLKIKNIILGGGVSANSYLRKELTARGKASRYNLFIPPLELTTDNAAMIGLVASKKIAINRMCKFDAPTSANLDLEIEGE